MRGLKIRTAPKDAPLFRSAIRKTGKLSTSPIHVNDICRMMKRRLKDAGLSGRLSPHLFRVTTITNLLDKACRSKTCSAWPATPTRAQRASTTGATKRSRGVSSSGLASPQER